MSSRFPLAVVLSLICLAVPAWADFQAGINAYNRGDFETTLREIRPLADEGDSNAQFQLAMLYYRGRGVAQDYAKSRLWWEKAAVQGHRVAQYNLGILYHEGRGVPQDYDQARQWCEKAAAHGYADAQFQLALWYAKGEGVPQDDGTARQWWVKAAAQGHAKAQGFLGSLYSDGKGVPQDYIQAHMWFNLSAANGEKTGAEFRDLLARKMTPAQITEAQKLAREWKPNIDEQQAVP